ncbi:MAG: CHAD domain-containing protein [Thermoleophilaceae bacterium]|nr:CHAD domain-containing protein [Thermoleophilaceae bacterium]
MPDEVRRVAHGRIDHALDEVLGRSDSTREEAVHEARKDMKKLRALLRLVRGELGDPVYSSENASARDTARELAGVRDADVMLATLGDLEERYGELPGAGRRLRPALVAHRFRTSAGSLTPASKAAAESLSEARDRVADWPLETDGFEAFEEGLGRIYRHGRRDFLAAQKLPSAELIHEWRERTKDLWYHLSLLEDTWKPVVSALSDEAHELSDRLGDDHDLAVLLDWAYRHAGELDGADPVLRSFDAIVDHRRRELQVEAFAYGARLYSDKPSIFVGRLEGWWDGARHARRAEAARR